MAFSVTSRKTLIMKFGGAAVATPQHFSIISDIILQRQTQYQQIGIVVSAMGDTTNQLEALARQVNPNPPRREYDMLVTVGERISISLLAMALAAKGCEAVSFTGSQSGIITCARHSNARVVDVRPHRLIPHISQGRVVIVAGFQGVSRNGEITTLGRGGSDTTAVALAIALGADRVEFYKDVPGIFDADPKKNDRARFLPSLGYEEALNIIQRESRHILHPRCVKLAQRNQMPLHVRSFKDSVAQETVIGLVSRGDVAIPVYEEDQLDE